MAENTVKINAIVAKALQSGENDRTLTLLSPKMGKLTVIAKGVRSLKHQSRSSCVPLTDACFVPFRVQIFVLKKIKDGFYSLVSADLIESFRPLMEDVVLLSYGAYFADLCRIAVQSGIEAEEEVRLLLNTLFVLCKRPDCPELIKTVYELKLMELCGIMPEFSPECPCGEMAEYFSLSDGEVRCKEHRDEASEKISPAGLALAIYISENNLKDALFANADNRLGYELSKITEPFWAYHLGKLPESLQYLRKISRNLQ